MILATADTVSRRKASRRTALLRLAARAVEVPRGQVRDGDPAAGRPAAQLDGDRQRAGTPGGNAGGHEAAPDRERAGTPVAQAQARAAEAIGDQRGDLDRGAHVP